MEEPRSIEDIEARLDEIRAEVQNLDSMFTGRPFDDESRRKWNDLNEEKAAREKTLAELRKRRNRLRELAGVPGATERASTELGTRAGPVGLELTGTLVPSFSSGSRGRSGIPALWPSPDDTLRLHRAALSGANVRIESRAAVTTALSGADELGVQLGIRARRERRIVAAAGLGAEFVAGVTSVAYPVFGAGAAGIVAEGAGKPEYAAVSPGSATPQVIAIWTDVTRQNILTMTNFESKLRSVLSAKVANREDLLVVTQVLATAGIQTLTGALSADLVLQGAAMVAAGDVASEPNLVAVNPADVPVLLGPDIGAGGTASPPFASFLPSIHGMSVYPTNHVTAGEALIGAWPAAAHFVVGLAPVFLVDAFSGIKTNTITMLLEEAVTVAVDEPAGFLHITAT